MRILSAFLGLFAATSLRADPLDVGSAAPDISTHDQAGTPVQLGELYKKGLVLVYFYPKADTPGCTKQACSLRDAYEALSERGITVVGVSADGDKAQAAFSEKYNLPFTLIPDADKAVINAFGVPTTMGFASRQAYLIKNGVIVWRDLTASTSEQATDVLAALDSLEKSPT